MPRLELGLTDGMAFSSDSVDAIEAAINAACFAGDIRATIRTVAPPGWLMMNGQVVVNAQTLYPDLWTCAPDGWKSGASLTLPNMANRVPIGAGDTPLNTAGGTNIVYIEQASLPAVGIGINPPPLTIDPPPTWVTEATTPVSGFSPAAYSLQSGPSTVQSVGQSPGSHPLLVDIAPFDVDPGTFLSGDLGGGDPLPLPAPPHVAFNFMIAAF